MNAPFTATARPRPMPRGFTLVEVTFASVILALSVAGLLTGLNMGNRIAKRAQRETECELRCLDRMEAIMMAPYDTLSDSNYPPEYEEVPGIAGQLEWMMTTTVSEMTLTPNNTPILYKRVDIFAGWNTYGGQNKYTTFILLRSPVELKEIYSSY